MVIHRQFHNYTLLILKKVSLQIASFELLRAKIGSLVRAVAVLKKKTNKVTGSAFVASRDGSAAHRFEPNFAGLVTSLL